MGFCGDLKAAISLDQSPLATSSGVGSSGCAILQCRQDTIRYGCDSENVNSRVYQGLVFIVIVALSLSSLLYSIFNCFPYL